MSRGQARLVEMIIMVALIAVAYIYMSQSTRPARSLFYRDTSDLRRFAYNMLNDLANSGVYEKLVLNNSEVVATISSGEPDCQQEQRWVNLVRAYLVHSLPRGLGFSMRISYYNFTESRFIPLHCAAIQSSQSLDPVESESISYTYVSIYAPDTTRGVILRIDLEVGYGG